MKKKRKRHKGLHFLLFLIFLLLAISIGGFFYLKQKNVIVSLKPVAFHETIEPLYNPYCGWYHTHVYTLSPKETAATETEQTEETEAPENTWTPDEMEMMHPEEMDKDTRLCQICIDLSPFREGEITDDGLQLLENILSYWSISEKQLLLKFYYETEPAQMDIIYLHMEETAPVINQFANSIYALQGELEQESSLLFTENNLEEMITYADSLIDKSIFLSVATPRQYYVSTGYERLISDGMAYTSVLPARLGLYSEYLTSYNRDEDATKAVRDISCFTPCGGRLDLGETVTDSNQAMALLSDVRVSFLSMDGTKQVEQWKQEQYTKEDSFSGVTVYDYVTTHLGYRYIVTDASVSYEPWKDTCATLRIAIKNVGFSNAYKQFETRILLKNTSTEEVITIPLEQDNRFWMPEEEIEIMEELDIKTIEEGNYNVYLLMVDTSTGETIKFGNTMPMTSNGYQIGVLEVQKN